MQLEKQNKIKLPIHAESLLHIGLVRQLFSDRSVQLLPRRVDQNWHYQKALPHQMSGFNPFLSTVFYGLNSCLANWLSNPKSSARIYNINDNLVREVFFAVHDYLHIWAFKTICSLKPDLGFGTKPITSKNIEDFVFLHLLTEACAATGFDYWYLATLNVNDVCNIGTTVHALTVNYHENDLSEFRRFNPKLEVQKPSFLSDVTAFYCSGELEGFDVNDMRRSPKLIAWLRHELIYGAKQREYTRQWFSYLANENISFYKSAAKLNAPVECNKKWQRDLITQMSDLLWEKVKNNKIHKLPCIPAEETWQVPKDKPFDWRFLNLNHFEKKINFENLQIESNSIFEYLFYQYVATYDFEGFDLNLVKLFGNILDQKNTALMLSTFKNLKRLPVCRQEPTNLFMLG